MSQALPASPCNESFAWMRSMRTSSIMRYQSIFSCGMHCRCRRMGFPVPEHLLLISGQTFSSCRAPSSSRVTSISQAEKLLSLSLDYNISLSPQQLADASALSSCAYRNNVGCETASPPCKFLCGIFVDRVCVSSGHHCNTSATQHLLIFHKVRCGVRAGVLLPYPSQAFVAAGRLHAMRCPLAFVYLSALCSLFPVSWACSEWSCSVLWTLFFMSVPPMFPARACSCWASSSWATPLEWLR